jgi:sec-independent protein translocase protein TatB
MLNIGFGELLVLVALVLIVVGPERLPHMMRSMGRMYGKVRRQSDELRRAFMAEADLLDVSDRRVQLRERQRQIQEAQKQKDGEQSDEGGAPPAADADTAAAVANAMIEGDTAAAEQALAAVETRTLPAGVVPQREAPPKETSGE